MSNIKDTEALLAEIKETLKRKDETYRLIADSKPREDCQCVSCTASRFEADLEEWFDAVARVVNH